jgi:hypothetical protein
VSLVLGFSIPASAGDYAAEISAYRRAHGLSSVKLDSRLSAAARMQAQAMAASGSTATPPRAVFRRASRRCANPEPPKISQPDF